MHSCQHFMRLPALRSKIVRFQRSVHLNCVLLYPRQIRNNPAMLSLPPGNEATLSSSNDTGELNPVVVRCREILASLPNKRIEGSDDVEYVYSTKFGRVRFDSDNMPPEGEENTFLKQSSMKPSNLNEIDKQYFNVSESEHVPGNSQQNGSIYTNDSKLTELNEIDDQYFGGVNYNQGTLTTEDNLIVSRESHEVKSIIDPTLLKDAQKSYKIDFDPYCPPSKQDLNTENDLNYVDEVFFKDAIASEGPNYIEFGNNTPSHMHLERNQFEEDDTAIEERLLSDFEKSLVDEEDELCTFTPDPKHELTARSAQTAQVLVDKYKQVTTKDKSLDSPVKNQRDLVLTSQETRNESSSDTEVASASTDKLFNTHLKKDDNLTEDSAFDYVMELRRKKKMKSLEEKAEDGSAYVPKYKKVIASLWSLEDLSQKEMTSALKKCIIYDQHGVVALFKPYGLRVHRGGDSGRRKNTYTLQDILPHLCKVMKIDHLHHVHRLDVTTTGVLLLARTEEVAVQLRRMFQEHKVVKNYLAISKGVPSILQGVIDIPLKEGTLDGKHRMILRPSIEDGNQRNQSGFRAVSKYKVLSKLDSASLIYVQPLTGVKHQIRAHLGFGLSCPIIGDHKYSSYKRIVPQKLNSDILHKLDIRQSRVRDLPMMLHASSIFLPQFVEGKNLKISCPPPPHFTRTMKALHLNKRTNVVDAKTLDFIDLGSETV